MAEYKISEICTGCMACVRLCPVGAISGRNKERQVIDPKLCIGCCICGNICPKGAVFDYEGNQVERMKLSDRPKAFVDRDLCSGCGNCIPACPRDCIDLVERAKAGHLIILVAEIDREKCIGCGLCEDMCSKDSIKIGEGLRQNARVT